MILGTPEWLHGRAAARHRLLVAKFTFTTLVALLVACCTAVAVDDIERADISRAASHEPVVLGRLHIRSAGGISIMPYHPGPSDKPRTVRLTDGNFGLVRLPDAKVFVASVAMNGRFAWSLGPGIYVIERLRGHSEPLSFNYDFCPKIVFRVERPAGIVNLGELLIEFPSDPTQRHDTPGFLTPTVCDVPENQVNVTQEAGEITRLVLHPLTPIVKVPKLPDLWSHREEINPDHRDVRKARTLLRELGITISG